MNGFSEDRKALAENPRYYNNLRALDAIFAGAKPRKPTGYRADPLTSDEVAMLRQEAAIRQCPIWMLTERHGIEADEIREIVTGKVYREAGGPICLRYV